MAVRESPFGWIPVVEDYRIVVATGTSAEEYLTDLPSLFRRYLHAAYFFPDGNGAGAGATRLFRVIKNASTVAASATIVLADTEVADKGDVLTFTNGTKDDRTFDSGDTITLDVTGAGTQFTTLAGHIRLVWLCKPQAIPTV